MFNPAFGEKLKTRSALKLKQAAACSMAKIETLETRTLLTGTWTALTHTAPTGIGPMTLLSNGDVMAQTYGTSNTWELLTPSSSGSYVNGLSHPQFSSSRFFRHKIDRARS